jgi:hypothetical protein
MQVMQLLYNMYVISVRTQRLFSGYTLVGNAVYLMQVMQAMKVIQVMHNRSCSNVYLMHVIKVMKFMQTIQVI